MAFCPTCRKSFAAGVTQCPEHHVDLVDELPFQAVAGDTTTWVEIASSGTEDQAQLLQGFLEAEGIPAEVENVKFNMEPINFGTMGDIRIYVAAENEARAQQLLREREKQYDRLDEDEETLVTDEGPADIDENTPAESETETAETE